MSVQIELTELMLPANSLFTLVREESRALSRMILIFTSDSCATGLPFCIVKGRLRSPEGATHSPLGLLDQE